MIIRFPISYLLCGALAAVTVQAPAHASDDAALYTWTGPGNWQFYRAATGCGASLPSSKPKFGFWTRKDGSAGIMIDDLPNTPHSIVSPLVVIATSGNVPVGSFIADVHYDASSGGFQIEHEESFSEALDDVIDYRARARIRSLAGADAVIIADRDLNKLDEFFVTGLADAVRVHVRCIGELENTDPGSGAAAVTHARLLSDPADLIRFYPERSLELRSQGRVVVALVISAKGEVSDCRVTVSSRDPALDEETCQRLNDQMTYAPALDSAGKPTQDTLTQAIDWKLP